jgi:ankyrin repeat protein
MTDGFRAALAAIDAGDIPALEKLLSDNPDLVNERVTSDDPVYNGYFHGATLLHHVAGNPIRGEIPDNIAEVVRVLLDAGADVNAECGGGPAQPNTAGGTVLGLVVSGGRVAERGLAEGLIDTLLAAGANIQGDRGVMWLALYHTVECQRQREVAEMLYDRGASVDLCMAAGVGKVDVVERFFNEDGSLTADAYSCQRPPSDAMTDPTRQQILQEALAYACMNGRIEVAKLLLGRGAEINGTARVASMEVTPLHCAAWAGWTEMAESLVERGADVNRLDPTHESTPIGWAKYCHHPEVVELLLRDESKLDMVNAIEFNRIDRVKTLLGDNDPDRVYPPGEPGVLLRASAYHGHAAIVEYLLERGADSNLACSDGRTPLYWAIDQKHEDVAKILKRYGAVE